MSDSLLGLEKCKEYLAHAFCINGTCRLIYNEEEITLRKGDLLIIRRGSLVHDIVPDSDFVVKVIYVSPSYIEQCIPHTSFSVKMQLSLFKNPVLHLSEEQQFRCMSDFRDVEYCLDIPHHNFHNLLAINVMQRVLIDFMDFFSENVVSESEVSSQYARIMMEFLQLLEQGRYREHREVSYYASELCITSKYLSEVSKKMSGFSANYWINRFTILDISQQLRNRTLSLSQISEIFKFSSPAYFSRYVQHNLGFTPSSFRK